MIIPAKVRAHPPQLGLRTEWRGSHTLGKSKTTANKSYRHPGGSCMHGPCSHSFLFMALGRNGPLTGIWRNTRLTSHIFRNKFHFIAISACAFPGISAWPLARYDQKCTQQQKWQNSPKVLGKFKAVQRGPLKSGDFDENGNYGENEKFGKHSTFRFSDVKV